MKYLSFALLLFLPVLAACNETNETPPEDPPSEDPPSIAAPAITSFKAIPNPDSLAEPLTLSWSVSGEDVTLTLEPDGVDVSAETSVNVNPYALGPGKANYTLTATNSAGTDTAKLSISLLQSADVDVYLEPNPLTFEANREGGATFTPSVVILNSKAAVMGFKVVGSSFEFHDPNGNSLFTGDNTATFSFEAFVPPGVVCLDAEGEPTYTPGCEFGEARFARGRGVSVDDFGTFEVTAEQLQEATDGDTVGAYADLFLNGEDMGGRALRLGPYRMSVQFPMN